MASSGSKSTRFDCLIIGGGPAGLTAALTLARQLHTAAVFDSGEYHNSGTSHVHTVPTWDHQNPSEFRRATRDDTIKRYNTVTYFDVPVQSVRKVEGGTTVEQNSFELVTARDTYYGAKVILASGVEDILPDIPGFTEAWPRGIFHCLFCHGYEERDAESCGILSIGPFGSNPAPALHSARNALQLAKTAVFFTHGSKETADAIEANLGHAKSRLSIDARRIIRIEKTVARAEVILHLEDGNHVSLPFMVHMPRTRPRGNFVQSLGIELDQMGNVAIKSMFNETSVRGVFAAGDLITMQKIVNQAVWSGCSAAAGAASQLQADNWERQPIEYTSSSGC